MWQWFHRWGSPKWFYLQSGRWLLPLAVVAGLLLTVGVVWGLAFAPADYQQGDSFRIIYIHVPAAMLSQSAYLLMALAGAVFLIWKIKVADMVATAAAPIGAAFCVLALITGAIWGKPTWGAWWVWDARTTSTLLLFFLYLGVIALRSALLNPTAASRACSVLALVGLVNIPIIKYSVEWWFTLHQGATFKLLESPAMPASMYLPLLLTGIGYYLWFAFALLLSARVNILERERKAAWVTELIKEQSRQ